MNKYPPFPAKINIGEKYGPAMKITDPEDARQYFERLVEHGMENGAPSLEAAAAVERSNLGYYAGYYDNQTRLRVEELFSCSHPIFGKAGSEPVSSKEAFMAGQSFAAKRE